MGFKKRSGFKKRRHATTTRRSHRRRFTRGVRRSRVAKMDNFHLFRRTFCLLAPPPGASGITTAASAGGSIAYNGGYVTLVVPATSTGYYSFGIAAMLQQLPSVTEFSSLFDRYRINGWSFFVIPTYNTYQAQNPSTVSAAGNGSVCIPTIHSVLDLDDYQAVTPSEAGLDDMRQYHSYRVKHFTDNNMIWKKSVKYPRVNIAAEQGADIGIPISKAKPWVDFAAVTVPHHGIKFIIEILNPTTTTVLLNFKMQMKQYFQCKEPR